jgi:hypothetical protein
MPARSANPLVEATCVLVANEPQAYREVLAAALRQLMPGVRILEIEPDTLASSIAALLPRVVICSRLGAVRDHLDIAWMVLYPEGKGIAIENAAGKRTIHPRLDLSDLVAFVDAGLRPHAEAF